MKTKVTAALVALVLFAVAAPSFAEVHFKDLSFDAAKKQAVKEKKKIMVDFYTTWCGWCKVLDRNTYSDEQVGKIADAGFISIKIDAEKGEGIALAKQYGISGYPTVMFFTAEGKEVDRVVGYQDPTRFARSLNLAANGGTKAILDEVNGKKEIKDPQKLLVAAEYYEEHRDNERAKALFARAAEADPQNDKHIKEEAEFHAAFLAPGEEKWSLMEHAMMQYPQRPEGQQATMLLLQHAFQTGTAEQDAPRLTDFWISRHPDDINVMNYFAWSAAEKGILLDQAEELATRAVSIAQTPAERATIMDTRAEVLFKKNRAQDALQQEKEAIALLDKQQDTKLYGELSTQLAKFEDAAAKSPQPPTELKTEKAQ